MTVYLFASITPKPEHVAEVEALMRDMVSHTRKEPGNMRYDLLCRADGAPGFYLYETYVDEAAVQAHRDSAHFVAYRAKIGAWVTEPPEVKLLKGVDVAD
ncbi:antibiotic biosynthesis monooxygenase [Paraburkholderia sp. CNPSo 3274]|uniref:putative quinol monooxygenase n=1 Tax=Paraburkholderia sp. CNPSo 3274 TaxID=2940932 RepID=UPI0020B6D736|nr:putative quinol monooxygenase [Paraburkholderia sp. CNPSo 3274]MCP3709967.1 antibiotic biosynthesis monooxygenase [Paraburkholderia sp. CNPSo 3274]